MNKTAENRRNAAESVLNGGIEYSAFENMDRLAAIFAMQKLLNDDIAARRGLDFSVEEWEQRLVLAMISELSEVLDEVNFKWWKASLRMLYCTLSAGSYPVFVLLPYCLSKFSLFFSQYLR